MSEFELSRLFFSTVYFRDLTSKQEDPPPWWVLDFSVFRKIVLFTKLHAYVYFSTGPCWKLAPAFHAESTKGLLLGVLAIFTFVPFALPFLSIYNRPLPHTVCNILCVSTIELTISTVMLLLHLSIVKFYPVSEPVAWLCTQKNKQISEPPCNHQNAHDFAESSTWRLKTSVGLS